MIKKLLHFIGTSAKTLRDKVDDSLDFIDDTLEAEYITGTIDKVKDASGQAVQKAGETVERGKMLVEDIMEDERLADLKEKGEHWLNSGKNAVEEALNSAQIQEVKRKVTDRANDLAEGAEQLSDRLDTYLTDKLGVDEEE